MRRRVIVLEFLSLAVLLLFAGVVACTHLRSQDSLAGNFFNDTQHFGVSVMLLAGRGFVQPDASAHPPLADFLAARTEAFDLSTLPPDLPVSKPRVHTYVRAYLVVLTAAAWALCGVSWSALAVLAVLFYAATVSATYLVFRLAMGRILSIGLTMLTMSSAAVMQVMPDLRDASKAPFFLLVLFVLGLLIRKPWAPRRFIGLAVLAGVLTGIGLGFRQDLVVCVPACIAVLLIFARGEMPLGFKWRAAGVAAYVAALLAATAPVPWKDLQGGSEFPHNAVMGLAESCDVAMNVGAASYSRLLHRNDVYVQAIPHTYYYRNFDWPVQGLLAAHSMEAEKAYLMRIVRTFPADLIIRWMASVHALISAGYMDPPLSSARRLLLLSSAAATLALAAGANLRMGFGLLFLMLYFGGYPSLQFDLRHFSHLAFVPFWFPGALVAAVLTLVMTRARARTQEDGEEPSPSPAATWLPALRRVAVFALMTALPGALVFGVAAGVQYRAVGALMRNAESTEAVPLVVVRQDLGAVQAFNLDKPLNPHLEVVTHDSPYNVRYLMAEFEGVDGPFGIWFNYISGGTISNDWSGALRVQVEPAPGQTVTVRYYFPAIECWRSDWPDELRRFRGIVLDNETAARFRGLYRVENARELDYWPYLAVPSDKRAAVRMQRIGVNSERWGILSALTYTNNPYFEEHRQLAPFLAESAEQWDENCRAALSRWPELPSLWLAYARFLEEQGRPEESIDALSRAIEVAPMLDLGYNLLARLSRRVEGDAAALERLERLSAQYPASPAPCFFLGRLREVTKDFDGATAAYRQALERDEGHTPSRYAVQRLTSEPVLMLGPGAF